MTLGLATTIAVAWAIARWSYSVEYGGGGTLTHAARRLDPSIEASRGLLYANRNLGAGVLTLSTIIYPPDFPYFGDLPHQAPVPEGIVPWWARRFMLPWGRSRPWPPNPSGGDEDPESGVRWMKCFGWPLPALAYRGQPPESLSPSWGLVTDLWVYRRRLAKRVILPLYPLWPNLLANSCLYAAAWWLVLSTPRLARRHTRRAHACPTCRYDLRGLTTPVCPECGSPAPDAAPATAASSPVD